MNVALSTLGCKLNQAETEFLAKQLTEEGHQLVPRVEEADVYILNTCTVTHTADAKSRHLLRQIHRRNPDVRIIATGCYAQRASQELAQIEGVNLVVGHREKPRLVPLLEETGYLNHPSQIIKNLVISHKPTFRTRAFIKVQDGCNNCCAYCIVPSVRGREKSLAVDQVVTEVKHRLALGYQEIVLTGSVIGSYQADSLDLKGLLEHILTETKVARLRLSSLQPQEISPQLLELWPDSRLCPHFHLSLQSGSDKVLRRMKRRYSVSEYQKALSLIRTLVPQAAATTDVIVGFPGETEAEFTESYRFCQQMGFARIHVFPFSPRQGTEAAQMTNQVNGKAIKERSLRMQALAQESAQNFSRQFFGKTLPVLWEGRNADGIWSGLTDNYIRVYAKSAEDLANQLLPVTLD